jgi:hypothetical protein
MPRRFLTKLQIEQLQTFPEIIGYNNLITYFTVLHKKYSAESHPHLATKQG